MGFFEFIQYQIEHNQFASAALIAAPATIIAYSIRNIPNIFFNFIKKYMFIKIVIKSDEDEFHDTLIFLSDNVINERFSKSFKMKFPREYTRFLGNGQYTTVSDGELGKKIGYGFHHGRYKMRYVGANYYYKEDDQSSGYKEICEIYILGFSRLLVSELAVEIKEYSEVIRLKSKALSVYTNIDKNWVKTSKVQRRSIDSIFLPNDIPNRVLSHIKSWKSNQGWNRSRGLPTNTGIILHGPPGTSKTSLIHATATETKRDIYYLNLSAITAENQLMSLMSSDVDWDGAILAIEDIDATSVHVGKRGDEVEVTNSKVSLSTLLNILDGIITPPNLLIMATTNRYESIDPALLRPGRFDLCLEVGLIGYDEFVRMSEFFDKDIKGYSRDTFVPMTGSEARSILINPH